MASVLIIDDDVMICEAISAIIKSMGHQATCAFRLGKGLELVSIDDFDLVFLDVNLPDGNGLKAIPHIKKAPSLPEVVIITGEGSRDGAELAIRSGSWDYVQKPLSVERAQLLLIRVLQYREEKSTRKTPQVLKRDGIVGTSLEINSCLDLVAQAANSGANVLVSGETGTGKELFARAIHENSQRAQNPFVVVDCTALPPNLIESTLFGHERGAFTGADLAREGLIKEADGGTLFLDEVGELPLSQQRAFLRVLQERRFRTLGGKKDTISDFRLIAATNRDLEAMAKAGTFREDLFFRLRSLIIRITPLRNRSGDIKDIASYYLTKLSGPYGAGQKGYSPEFIEAIIGYPWPGNVRELVHAIESALSESQQEPTLFPIHLPNYVRSQLAKNSVNKVRLNAYAQGKADETPGRFPELKKLVDSTESKYFQDLIKFTGGDIQKICCISGLSRSNVYTRFKKYNLFKSTT